MAVAAGTAWVLAGSDVDETVNEATARLGLTEETGWPFYDVELEAGRFLATTNEFRDAVETIVGFEVSSIDGNLPESLAVFDLTVIAETAENAVEAADVAAVLMVERTLIDAKESHVSLIERSDIEIVDVQAQIAVAETDGDTAGDALTALYIDRASGNDDPALFDQEFELTAKRQEAASIHSDLERKLVSLETARASAVAWFSGKPTLRIVRAAVAGETTDSSQVPVTIAAGFGALLLASAIVIALDRRVGSVRSSWQLANIGGAPVHTELSVGSGRHISGCGALVDALDAGRESNTEHRMFGVINLADVIELDDLAQSMSVHGLHATVALEEDELGLQSVSLIDVSEEYLEADTPRSVSRLCDSLILLVDKKQSLASTTAIIAQSSMNPGLISAAFVRGTRR